MSVFGGDSWAREAHHRKRRVDDLMLSSSSSSSMQLSNGKLHHRRLNLRLDRPSLHPRPRRPGTLGPQNSDQQVLHNNAWNPWAVGMPPMFFCSHLPIHHINSADASSLPSPLWWPLCGGLTFHEINSENSPKHQAEAPDKFEAQKESSWSGSDATSSSEVVDSQIAIDSKEEMELVTTSKLKPSVNSAFRSLNSGIKISSKGFIPYKRCTTLREIQHPQPPQMVSEDEDGGRVELCL